MHNIYHVKEEFFMSLSFILCAAALLVVPAIMIFCGLVRKNLCGKIGSKFGYKTELSMTSMDAWNYAQNACPVLYTAIGAGLLAGTALMMRYAVGASSVAVIVYSATLLLFQCFFWGVAVIVVESGLRNLLGIKSE